MEKISYEVNLDDITVRRAKITDNMREIALLVYQTDPYIYPYWFENDEKKAVDFLSEYITKEGFIFNYNNLYIAIDKQTNKIIGLVVALDKSINFDFDYNSLMKINKNYEITIKKYIKEIIKDVKEHDDLYIMNCTVLEGLRGRRIGTKLLGNYIKNMERAGFEDFRLDCLLRNLRAKNLYHTLGFKEMELVTGFSGYYDGVVDVVVFKRHKGDFFPYEFKDSSIFPN